MGSSQPLYCSGLLPGILRLFQSLPTGSAWTTVSSSHNLSRSFKDRLDANRFRNHQVLQSTGVSKTSFLRLSSPTTHTGMGSPLTRGLPRPVLLRLQGFVPSWRFTPAQSSEPYFRSKRSWGFPFRVSLVSKSRASFKAFIPSCLLTRYSRPRITLV